MKAVQICYLVAPEVVQRYHEIILPCLGQTPVDPDNSKAGAFGRSILDSEIYPVADAFKSLLLTFSATVELR